MKVFKGLRVLTPNVDWAQKLEIIDFSPPLLLRGGDLQTMGNRLFKTTHFKSNADTSEIKVSLSKRPDDALVALLDHPKTRITPSSDESANESLNKSLHESKKGKPLVLLVHGLGGDADSMYYRQTTGFLLGLGYSCLRLNLRGAGLSAKTSKGFYHAGKSEDLRAFIKGLPKELSKNGILVVGYSLGANMTLKMLGEGDVPASLKGAVAISPPLSLKSTQVSLDRLRNYPYQGYLIDKLRMVLDNAQIDMSPTGLTTGEAKGQKNIWAFDNHVVAPLHGFQGADDYYNQSSSGQFLRGITIPTLIIHAKTDPWIPYKTFEEAAKTAGSGCLMALVDDGGHVGFQQKGLKSTWHDQIIANQLRVL